jgi:hypothetical protein
VLALIVAVAAATRLTFTNLAEFKDDEAKVAMLAVSFLEGKGLPLIGIISSVGVNNPPAYVYLMAIPFAISRDPAVATAFIGLLGVGAVPQGVHRDRPVPGPVEPAAPGREPARQRQAAEPRGHGAGAARPHEPGRLDPPGVLEIAGHRQSPVLLLEGLGDTIRVSLTGDKALEVYAGFDILKATGRRVREPEIIACPLCGRAAVAHEALVRS